MASRKAKIVLWSGLAALTIFVLTVAAGLRYIRRHIPAEILPDLRAAIAVRGVVGADNQLHQYLEKLYGPMDVATNREHAFEDFFNPHHIKAMQLIVKHTPHDKQLANIRATADWIQNYRQNMSAEERADLSVYFDSNSGRTSLQAATAQFMQQDPEYRSAVVPVITQLMTTLASVNK